MISRLACKGNHSAHLFMDKQAINLLLQMRSGGEQKILRLLLSDATGKG